MDQCIICAQDSRCNKAMDLDQDFSLKDYWCWCYTIASCLQNIQRSIQEMKTVTLNGCWKNCRQKQCTTLPDALLIKYIQGHGQRNCEIHESLLTNDQPHSLMRLILLNLSSLVLKAIVITYTKTFKFLFLRQILGLKKSKTKLLIFGFIL